jgi:putative ribosome biogenesis GTPase RsgA
MIKMKLITLSRSIVSTLCLSIIIATTSGCNTHRRNTVEDLDFENLYLAGKSKAAELATSTSQQKIVATTKEKINNEAILFLGNPGAGKSTLLNSIFQEARFTSGTSIGRGLTDSK